MEGRVRELGARETARCLAMAVREYAAALNEATALVAALRGAAPGAPAAPELRGRVDASLRRLRRADLLVDEFWVGPPGPG